MNFKKLIMPAVFAVLNLLPSITTVAMEIEVSCGSAESRCAVICYLTLTVTLKNREGVGGNSTKN